MWRAVINCHLSSELEPMEFLSLLDLGVGGVVREGI